MEAAAAATKSFNAPETKLHFLDYWRIIRIRKTVILAVFLLVAITTTLVTFILPESFASTVRMKVEKDASDIGGGLKDNFGGGAGFDPYWVQDQFETIQSKLILYQVITNMHLNKKWAEKYKEGDDFKTEQTYGILKSKVDVRQSRGTSLIEIRVLSEDKTEAAEIANEIAEVYRQSRLNSRKENSQHGIETLRAQLKDREVTISNKQELVNKMKADLNIPDTDSTGYPYMGDTTPDGKNLEYTERLRIEAKAEYSQMNTLYMHLTNMSPVELRKALPVAYVDQALNTLMQDLNAAEQKQAELVQTYGGEHPEVKRVTQVISTINVQLENRLQGIMAGINAKTAATKAKLDQFEIEAANMKTSQVQTVINRRPYFMAKRELENLQQVQ